MQYREENNYPKALLFSAGAMVLFLLISYWISFGSTAPPIEMVGTGGIVVNYGTSETGMGDDLMSVEEPSVAPNANNTPPDKVTTTSQPDNSPTSESSDEKVVTQDLEDAPAVTTSKKSTSPTPATSTPKESKPTVNENALYKGKKSTGSGGGDGTGTTPGNQGDKDGDPLSSNYGSGGSGFGNTQLDLSGRKFVSLPRISDDGQTSGKVAVEIRVGKNGEVEYARAGVRGTTISDKALWQKCEQAVRGARLNRLESAPDVQMGTVVFNFKVN